MAVGDGESARLRIGRILIFWSLCAVSLIAAIGQILTARPSAYGIAWVLPLWFAIWLVLALSWRFVRTRFAHTPSVGRAIACGFVGALFAYYLIAVAVLVPILVYGWREALPGGEGGGLEDVVRIASETGFFLAAVAGIVLIVLDFPRRWWRTKQDGSPPAG